MTTSGPIHGHTAIQRLIEAGKYASVREAARAEGVAKTYAAKISKMVLLASDPRLTELGTFWFEMAVFEFAAL
jgi:hypothetical protein